MELRDYIRILRAHWIGAVFVVLATLAVTVAYTLSQAPVYAADASGLVSTGATSDPALGSLNDQLAKSRAVSYVPLAESRATALDVKESLRLEADPASLINQISVEQPPDTVLLRITARAGTPQEAKELADAWVAALARQVAEIEDPEGEQETGTLRVVPIEAAALPSAPVSPQPLRNLALGLLMGLLLALGYAMVRNVLDKRLRTPDAVQERFDVNVVGTIPASASLQASSAVQAGTQDRAAEDGAAGEAFRKLRTNLTYMDVDNPPRIIVVTSPRPGDGKSTVARNLAAAIAMSGQPVVLVDADLRRPTVAQSFGLVEGVGLTDVLVGRVSASEAVQGAADNLHVLAAGRVPPNPSELLGSKSMRSLVEELAITRMVILDAPPLLPVTDAAVLTARADGALVVIAAGQTVDHELATALSHLTAVNGKALGVILNKMSTRGAGDGYYSGYYTSSYSAADETRRSNVWRRLWTRRPTAEPPITVDGA